MFTAFVTVVMFFSILIAVIYHTAKCIGKFIRNDRYDK